MKKIILGFALLGMPFSSVSANWVEEVEVSYKGAVQGTGEFAEQWVVDFESSSLPLIDPDFWSVSTQVKWGEAVAYEGGRTRLVELKQGSVGQIPYWSDEKSSYPLLRLVSIGGVVDSRYRIEGNRILLTERNPETGQLKIVGYREIESLRFIRHVATPERQTYALQSALQDWARSLWKQTQTSVMSVEVKEGESWKKVGEMILRSPGLTPTGGLRILFCYRADSQTETKQTCRSEELAYEEYLNGLFYWPLKGMQRHPILHQWVPEKFQWRTPMLHEIRDWQSVGLPGRVLAVKTFDSKRSVSLDPLRLGGFGGFVSEELRLQPVSHSVGEASGSPLGARPPESAEVVRILFDTYDRLEQGILGGQLELLEGLEGTEPWLKYRNLIGLMKDSDRAEIQKGLNRLRTDLNQGELAWTSEGVFYSSAVLWEGEGEGEVVVGITVRRDSFGTLKPRLKIFVKQAYLH